ncbi:MAG: DUF3737 family protein, partial [Lachnospiraceae bacterium]|nr:DUF3737 family protein [Lachnospiraceae bacterium]
DLLITETAFENGESPLKESSNIDLEYCMFRWKYPLWYAKNINIKKCTWFEMARAGVWYTDNVSAEDCAIEAPKNFRRCKGVSLKNVSFPNASETLWQCSDVKLTDVVAKGDYFAMNSDHMNINSLTLYGNYSFDGCHDIEVRGSRLLSKDAFWNTKNVTVYDSFISGEYLGWNSEDLTLINCTIESLQGMCYIENLKMVNCRLINTTLAFEYSTVEADIVSGIDSVLNPSGGTISAPFIEELIIEKDRIDPSKTKIVCSDIKKRSDKPEWIP